MKITAYTLNAFAKTDGGGNPAGVVLNADNLSDRQMLAIAKKIGFSETAFVSRSKKADYRVRFFTPKSEVDLCGHATIATFYLMAQKKIIKKGKYTQETKAGILPIEIKTDAVFMDQNRPEFYDKPDKKEIADSLNITLGIIDPYLPVQVVSTGLKDILVPIKNMGDLNNIEPDFNKVEKISRKYNVIGYHLFSLQTLNNATAHCRNLAPLYEIDEEAATGTSSGALSCYLYKYGLVDESQAQNLVFEQGYLMGKPSEIIARLKIENDRIVRVQVGGVASNINKIKLNLVE